MTDFFAPLIGQPQAVELLTQAVIQHRVAPAYLFAGAMGIGKSLAARCFVAQLFCADLTSFQQQQVLSRLRLNNHPDLLWVEPTYLHQGQRLSAAAAAEAGLKRKAPPIIRTEQIREIAQFLSRPPLAAPRSVVVIEQAETMAEAAANALLKTLEEPGQATIILIAPAAESLLPTLVSRCQRIPFYRLNSNAMIQVLEQTDSHSSHLSDAAILALAQGSPGTAIAAGQKLATIPTDLLESVAQLPSTLRQALELARKIAQLDMEAQLWLADYWQHCYWQQPGTKTIQQTGLQQLEAARSALLSYAQPRLVWEVTMIALSGATEFEPKKLRQF